MSTIERIVNHHQVYRNYLSSPTTYTPFSHHTTSTLISKAAKQHVFFLVLRLLLLFQSVPRSRLFVFLTRYTSGFLSLLAALSTAHAAHHPWLRGP